MESITNAVLPINEKELKKKESSYDSPSYISD